MLLLVKLQLLACNFTNSNTPPWFFHAFKILQKVPNCAMRHMFTKNLNPSVPIPWYGQYTAGKLVQIFFTPRRNTSKKVLKVFII